MTTKSFPCCSWSSVANFLAYLNTVLISQPLTIQLAAGIYGSSSFDFSGMMNGDYITIQGVSGQPSQVVLQCTVYGTICSYYAGPRGGMLTLQDLTVSGGSAQPAWGIWVDNWGKLQLQNVVVTNFGGGIRVVAQSNLFTGNLVVQSCSTGVSVWAGSRAYLPGAVINGVGNTNAVGLGAQEGAFILAPSIKVQAYVSGQGQGFGTGAACDHGGHIDTTDTGNIGAGSSATTVNCATWNAATDGLIY